MPKKGEKLTEEQRAKLQAGREKAAEARKAEKLSKKKPKPPAPIAPPAPEPQHQDEEEFEPTPVAEAKEAGNLEPAEVPATEDKFEEVTEAPAEPEAPAAPALAAPAQFTSEQLMAMMLNMHQEIIELKKGNPQVVAATPEQKLDETIRLGGGNASDHQTARVGKQGVQGVVFKYPIEKSYYADPSERLMKEERLRRYAMAENYYFKWTVEGVEYEKHGITYAEPRFILELYRFLDDPESGERNGKMGLVNRSIVHEDEVFTRMAAIKLGILEKFENFEDLMAEVRYMRIRQWLFDVFTPPKVEEHSRRSNTQIIGGKAVEVFDTEKRIDGAAGAEKAAAVSGASGVGNVATPRI